MGYRKLLNVNTEEPLQDNPDLEASALKQVPYVQQLINDFITFYEIKYGMAISVVEDIAEKIAYSYVLMSRRLITGVEDKHSKFKMASLLELIIVQEQVLIHPSSEQAKNRQLNALFGMTAAFSLIDCMINKADREFFCSTLNNAINEKLQKMLDEHEHWLRTKQLNDMPVFINAQFYELVELIHVIPIQVNGY